LARPPRLDASRLRRHRPTRMAATINPPSTPPTAAPMTTVLDAPPPPPLPGAGGTVATTAAATSAVTELANMVRVDGCTRVELDMAVTMPVARVDRAVLIVLWKVAGGT